MEVIRLLKQVRFSVELKEMHLENLKHLQPEFPLVGRLGESHPHTHYPKGQYSGYMLLRP